MQNNIIPLISIIIPVYNRIEQFKKTLDSVLKQTYQNIEIIVVDDGSVPQISNFKFSGDTDPLGQIQNNIDIVFYRQDNKGAPAARNKGFEMSKGEYVIFLDADIIAESDMIEKMYHKLIESEKDFVYCNFLHGKKLMKAREFDFKKLKKCNFITPMTLMKRKIFPGFDKSLKRFQDWDLFLTIAENGYTGVWYPEVLFISNTTGTTMSTWLPKIAYKKPWKYLPWIRSRVEKYERACEIIRKKHHI